MFALFADLCTVKKIIMKRDNFKPPKLALSFFRWFCHPDYIEDIEGESLKLQWEEAESDDEFLEFKISRSPVTGETLLEINDWCDDDEVEDQQQLWSTQMNAMKKEMGG